MSNLALFRKLFFAALLMLAMWMSQTTARTLPANAFEKHEAWMAKYGRTYKDDAEKAKRFKIFMDNLEYIESFNGKPARSYELAVNEFADLTKEEIRAFRNGYKMPSHQKSSRVSTSFRYENVTEVPSSMDWRKKGAVTGVKDQGFCGSCWAFSAVGATEGISQIKTGKLVSLSEQELVDCDKNDYGCGGGFMDTAFNFIKKHGLTTESNYPYKSVNEKCDTKKESSYVKITDYEDVPANSESALLKALANQPISVAIEASDDFVFYSKGIFNGICGTELDHGVTLVGYGETKHGYKYWLVKNSWGTSWGDKGYIRMLRDVEAPEGICGIAMLASYPTI